MAQLIREAGGGVCLQFQVRGSLIPSPTPSFSSLAVLQATYSKQRKAGRGAGNEATLYLRASNEKLGVGLGTRLHCT